MTRLNSVSDAATIRTLLDNAPLHPSGFAPIAVCVSHDGEELVLVYYHDEAMLTQEVKNEGR